MGEGGDLLELFGSDLVTHRQAPAWNRRSILTALHLHPRFVGAGWTVLLIRGTHGPIGSDRA
jgi:hypothetical protein